MNGVLSFLLTDVEGSARAWQEGRAETSAAIARIEAAAQGAVAAHGGIVVKARGEGDSMFCAFPTASGAIAAAVTIQRALRAEPLRVRIGVHTGEAELRDGDYYGLTPSRAGRLRSLASGGQILVSSVTAAVATDLQPGITLRDLGPVVLAGFESADHVHQACHPDIADDFPPLRTQRTSLPAALTTFVGRDTERKQVLASLRAHRLTTLADAGGSGKSRLAIEAVRDVDDATVWFVDLAPVAAGDALAEHAARTVGVSRASEDAEQSLIARLRDEPSVVVLDNCEHIVDAVAAFAERLLHACPALAVVATSREPLGIPGEVVLRVPSLGVPGEGEHATMDDDAVRLFVDRAAAVQPGFVLDADNAAAVADICRRLDGIPLAIELAAARTSVLHPREIASRLDDRFALLTSGGRTALSRQRTLEASVDWSYDLLTDAEREVLRRLAVFVGTFSLDGARAVCERDVLDTLGSLVAKSLVTPVDVESLPRYRLLDTIRYYAHRKLVDAGQLDDALAAHLAYYRALSARIAAGFWTDANLQTIRTASAELGNIHAATDHALRAGDGLAALEAGVGVWSCLSLVGPRLENRDRVRRVLAAAVDAPANLRAVAYVHLISSSMNVGEPWDALAEWREARALLDRTDDPAALGGLRIMQGAMRAFTSLERAAESFAEARRLAADVPGLQARAMYLQGLCELYFGDIRRADELIGEAIGLARRAGVTMIEGVATAIGAMTAFHSGRLAEADLRAREAEVLMAVLPLNPISAPAVLVRCFVELARGDVRAAEQRFATVRRDAEAGEPLFEVLLEFFALRLAMWRGDHDAAVAHAERSFASFRFAWDQWHPLSTLAMVEAFLAAGDAPRAAQLVDRMDEQLAALPPYPAPRAGARLARARLHEASGDHVAAAEANRDAVRDLDACGMRSALPDALRALARALAAAGDAERGARLAGAADAARGAMGFALAPYEPPLDDLAAAYPDAFTAGAAMPLDDAVRYALRGRGGRRRRAATGWDSLTAAELDVVRHAAEGLTTKQIAGRMVLSPRTVQGHLSSVFAKLGVKTRAELAAEAARRGAGRSAGDGEP